MKKVQVRAAALVGLTSDHPRNEDVSLSLQTMYPSTAAADPEFMRPSPVFDSEFAKKSVRLLAFGLATLPLVACVVLTAKVIF
jgi:hypothetical protein